MEVNITPVDKEKARESYYDALSYSWGGHLMLRRIIKANNRYFLVTDTAFQALRTLRHPTETRNVWIDAICINQYDTPEKNQQVTEMMASIYEKAHKVIVWLGQAPEQLASAFNMIQELDSADDDQIRCICAKYDGWLQPLHTIMNSRWWSRVWVVQETALNSDVVVRSGQHELPWETLSRFLRHSERIPGLRVDQKVLDFVYQLGDLKNTDADPERGLLDLALRFRNRVATDPRDKLYGLHALLRSTTASAIRNADYKTPAPHVFAQFAGFYITQYEDLSVMTLAESRSALVCSWAVDWAKMTSPEWAQFDPFFAEETVPDSINMLWNGNLLPSIIAASKSYSAAGGLKAECTIGSCGWNSMQMAGWQEDVVETVGSLFEGEYIPRSMNQAEAENIIKGWEKLAGGPFSDPEHGKGAEFDRTLVVDAWREEQTLVVGLPDRSQAGGITHASSIIPKSSISFREVASHINITGAPASSAGPSSTSTSTSGMKLNKQQFRFTCCFQRRFFITRRGRFGLGPAETRHGDRVCVLLGSPVPFILRSSGVHRKDHYTFVGQAYVDGVMHYQGDLRQDIQDGKIEKQEFLIA